MHRPIEDWEIIVVDDGSSDNTADVLAPYQLQLKDKLRVIRKTNGGPSAARNAGIRISNGDIIALLDADDVWLPRRLARSVEELDRDLEVGSCMRVARVRFCKALLLMNPFQTANTLAGRIAPFILPLQLRTWCRRRIVPLPEMCYEKEPEAIHLTRAFKATKDRDLWFRIAQRSKVAYIDEILARMLEVRQTSDEQGVTTEW